MEGLCPDTRGPSCRRQKCPGSDEFEMNVSRRNVDMARRYARTINCFRQGQGTVTIGPLGEGSYLVARHMGIRRSADDFDPLVASQAKGQQLAHQRRIVGDPLRATRLCFKSLSGSKSLFLACPEHNRLLPLLATLRVGTIKSATSIVRLPTSEDDESPHRPTRYGQSNHSRLSQRLTVKERFVVKDRSPERSE
jgi:hypothetical protein